MKKINSFALFILTVLISLSACGLASAENKDKVEVLCHYMTWFRYRENGNKKLEISHWKWSGKNAVHDPRRSFNGKTRDVYSRFYPRIGIYDSGDPLVMDYHILTAKTAGISTLIIDWYKPGAVSDIAFQSLLERCEALNMKAAICYEEKTCFPDWNKISTRQEAVAKAVKDFTYMKKYFNRKAYWKKYGKPVVLVFSGWGDWNNGKKIFSDQEWSEITQKSGTDSWVVLQNHKEKYPSIKAAFSWLGLGDPKYLGWYYSFGDNFVEKGKLKFYIGSVCPGFDDRGTWGWNSKPRFEAYLGLENFDHYLKEFDASKCNIIQVVTWNDFSEGTMVEPTVQFGNLYLNRLGEWSAKRNNRKFAKIHTLLPYKWFYLAKSLGQHNSAVVKIKSLLRDEKYIQAQELIDKTATERKISIPPYISYDKEFKPYTVKTVGTKNAKTKTDAAMLWQSDGFLKSSGENKFSLSGRNYGSITEKNSHKLNEKISLEIIALSSGATYTVQLMMFNNKHKFLGSLDIKKSNKPAVVNIDIAAIKNKLKPDTAKVAFKIWLAGKPGSELKLK